MLTKQPILVFTGILTASLAVAMGIHVGLLNFLQLSFTTSDLMYPYLVNYVLAFVITVVLFMLREKQANSLGFIFMGSSFLKFIVFVLVFNPIYKEDGVLTPLEFGWFFVPYAISLIVETTFLVKILNEMD